MSSKSTLSLRAITDLVKQGEGSTLEFKRSTGELKGAMQTLCAFLNGAGGSVLFGILPNGGSGGMMITASRWRTCPRRLRSRGSRS